MSIGPLSRTASTRAFWLFWTASAISMSGDAISLVALPLTAITVLHATSLEVSLLTAANYTAWIVIGLPAGALVHRWPLRRVQVAADLVRAAALASVPIVVWLGALTIVQLVAVALIVGLATVLFDVANSTFIVSVVSREDLTRRNSLTSATVAATQTGGPSLGGLLVGLVGAAGAILFDVGSYLASAALLSRVPRGDEAGVQELGPIRAAVSEGLRYVIRHPTIGPAAAMAAAVNFVCGALMALGPLFLVRTIHAPVTLVGVLLASEGIGTLAGAAIVPRLVARVGSARLLRTGPLVGAGFALLMPLAESGAALLLFALGSAGFACGVVVLSVIARTHRQEAAPPELLPRVMASVRFLSWGVIPLGAIAAGGLAGVLGIRGSLALFCLCSFAVPAIGFATRIRRLTDLNELSVAEAIG